MASIIAKIIGDAKGFDKAVAATQGKLSGLKKAIGQLGIGLGVGATASFAKSLVDMGSRLSDVSDKLGVSTDFLQEWNFAAQENGIASGRAEDALQRFVRRLGEAQQGTGELLPSLEQYNIALFDSEGRMRSAEAVLRDYADTIANVEDPQERLRLSFKAFDSEGAALVTVMRGGAAALDEYAKKAHDLGQVLSEDAIANLDKASDRLGVFNTSLRVAGAEVLNFYIDTYGKIFGTVKDFFTNSEKLGKGFFKTPTDTGAATGPAQSYVEAANMASESFAKGLAAITKTEEKVSEIAKHEIDIEAIKSRQSAWQDDLNTALDSIADKEQARLELEKKLTEEKAKQSAELEKQRAASEAQVRSLQQQSAQFEKTGQFGFSFNDILSGTFGANAQIDAQRVVEAQARAQQALFFSGEDSEAFKRASGFANQAQEKFENRFGVDPVANPFKEALADAEDELKEIKDEIQKL